MLDRLFGDNTYRKHSSVVERINALEGEMSALSDGQLCNKTAEYRERLAAGEILDDILPEAFAAVREASKRTIGLRHYDVQLAGGMLLHEGTALEMRTGEGKTLVATLPLYLNALSGEGAHLVTVNDYLARRDARWMGPVFEALGMSVGVLQDTAAIGHGNALLYGGDRSEIELADRLRAVSRQEAYHADVTYGTSSEFGFDYLRDNMVRKLEDKAQRNHHYAIVDEVDSILIDEARTPLIISGPGQQDDQMFRAMAHVVGQLSPVDYEVNEKDKTVALTEAGERAAERLLRVRLGDPLAPEEVSAEQAYLRGHLEQALRARTLFLKDRDYVVHDGKVLIVDPHTGRFMPGRRWSDGIHQAVEAKEQVEIQKENATIATITLQNYFRRYAKLAGMSGTAVSEAEEFDKIYHLKAEELPTNLEARVLGRELEKKPYVENGQRFQAYHRPGEGSALFWQRKDLPDQVYRTREGKLRAVSIEILRRHALGQPLLVGTTSVEQSEQLSSRLSGEQLRELAMTLVLRDVYTERHGGDPDLRIDALQSLYGPLGSLGPTISEISGSLSVSADVTAEENLARLAGILGLEGKERLASLLQGGVRHEVLNARQHSREAAIIARAGALGAVTIATNMAGRGVDIKLGGELPEETLAHVDELLRSRGIAEPGQLPIEERLAALPGAEDEQVVRFREYMSQRSRVMELGGLHVIGTERHEARRIDNQLRGRAARQGDPGSSQFYLSLEDDLSRLFGGAPVSSLMSRLGIDDMVPIAASIVNKTVEQAQRRIEGAHFDARKHLLDYDDVLNSQREAFYGQRDRILSREDLIPDVKRMLREEVALRADARSLDDRISLLDWQERIQPTFARKGMVHPSYMISLLLPQVDGQDASSLKRSLLDIASRTIERQQARGLDRFAEKLDLACERQEERMQRLRLLEEETLASGMDRTQLVGDYLMNLGQLGVSLTLGKNQEERLRDSPEEMVPELTKLASNLLTERFWEEAAGAASSIAGDPLEPVQDYDRLIEAAERAAPAGRERILGSIRPELDSILASSPPIDDQLKTTLLLQMAVFSRTQKDKEGKERKIVVPRLYYPALAAEFMPERDFADGIAAGLETTLDSMASREFNERLRAIFLGVSDNLWVNYLSANEALRTSVGLQAYGQRDPLVVFKSTASEQFSQLLAGMRAEVVANLFRAA